MKSVKHLIIFVIIFFSSLAAKEDHRVEAQPEALKEALALKGEGILRKKDNGFVYLDVDNAFIDSVVPHLELPGELRALPTAKRSLGAHISVFNEAEVEHLDELGHCFSFEVKEIRSFTAHTRDGLKKLWTIAVESSELEHLRASYGLSPKLKGHAYHITLGKHMPTAPQNWQENTTLSPLNFSEEPTEGLLASGNFVSVPCSSVIETARKVHQVGQLTLKSNGYIYLNVPNALVEEVSPLLPIQCAFTPLSTKSKQVGAHISVCYEDEVIGKQLWEPQGIGEWFGFEAKELRYFERGGMRYWLLAVEAPALERLRTQYGLKPKLLGHDFHITIGKEDISESALEANAA